MRLFWVLAAAWAALLWPSWVDRDQVVAGFGDLMAYHYPMRHLVAAALQEGRVPFWNPYIFGGLPLAANPQAVLFYPPALLGAFFPLALALSWDILAHGLWAGLGTYLLGRQQRLSRPAAAAWAGLYWLSPFLVYRVAEGIPTLLAGLAWIPWAWLAFASGSRALLAGVWALQFLSGHPQFMTANAAGMLAYAALSRGRTRALAHLAWAGAGAAVLAAVQWRPTAEFLGRSIRKVWNPAFSTAYSLEPRHLLTWAFPNALGNPLDGNWGDVPSVFFETAGIGLGLGGLALAVWGVRGGARRPLALGAAGLFLAAGGNNPLYRFLLDSTALGFLRTPSRYAVLCLLGLSLAAGAALRRGGRAALGLALLGIFQLLVWDSRFLRSEPADRYLGVNEVLAGVAGGRAVRVLIDPAHASANKTAMYRAMNINGYEAFYLEEFARFAFESEGRPAADASRAALANPDTPVLNQAGVAYSLDPEGNVSRIPSALRLAHFAGRPSEKLAVILERPERWTIAGTGGGTLHVALPRYPGWSAWLNGARVPTRPWLGLFQEVEIPVDGFFDLRLVFQTTGWVPLCALAATAWLAFFYHMLRAR